MRIAFFGTPRCGLLQRRFMTWRWSPNPTGPWAGGPC